MLILKATNETLELATSSSSAVDVHVSYLDITSLAASGVSSQETAISSATTTVILSAPGSSVQRQVKMIVVANKGSSSNTITLKKDIAGVEYILRSVLLSAGEELIYTDGGGFSKYNPIGEESTAISSDKSAPISATTYSCFKVGAASEAAGLIHFMGLSSGSPGAWAAGTPGINGRATDGTASGDAGCIPIKNPVSGTNYLTCLGGVATTAAYQMLIDLMWVNSGVVVTTTTAQSIAPIALPARDINGSTSGLDVLAGILVTTATTNAGAITNTTISYTNSDGAAGKTGTMASFPATAVAGTLIPFQLASGDKGVKSVESITLGTSYAGGAISLVLYRIIAGLPVIVANAGGQLETKSNMNIKIFNNSCILPCYFASATTATNILMTLNIEEK
jgi:hypothetical protein